MIKFAAKHARRYSKTELVLPHFFNARGTELEHSVEGMYRTLLYWLLKELPAEVISQLESDYEHRQDTAWQTLELAELLQVATEELADRPTTFYIDALDECPDDQVRGMLKVFGGIIQTAWFAGQEVRVCFASRPYPHITFTDAIFLDFSTQPQHIHDLNRYIMDELHIGSSSHATAIRSEVLRKAQGSFMWAVLVVRILNVDYDGGHLEKLSARLHEILPGLYELYDFTLKCYPNDHDSLLACCQWLIFSGNLLSASELWSRVKQTVGAQRCTTRELVRNTTYTEEDMERYIVDVSKGLIEFKSLKPNYTGTPYAQFLHESVREFILSSEHMRNVCGAEDRSAFERIGHEHIRDYYFAEVQLEQPTVEALIEFFGGREVVVEDKVWELFRQEGESKHAIAAVSIWDIILHAESAQCQGSDQSIFLNKLVTLCGPYSLDFSDHTRTRIVVSAYSLISLLLGSNCDALIRGTQVGAAQCAWAQGQPFGLLDGGPYSPILMALNRLCFHAVDALVSVCCQLRHWNPGMRGILEFLAHSWNVWDYDVDYGDKNLTAPLLDVARIKPSLASFFLLAMVADEGVDAHLDSMRQIFDVELLRSQLGPPPYRGQLTASEGSYPMVRDVWPAEMEEAWALELSRFLQLLYLFLDKGISSVAATFGDDEILEWIGVITDRHQGSGWLPSPPGDIEQLESLLRTRQGQGAA